MKKQCEVCIHRKAVVRYEFTLGDSKLMRWLDLCQPCFVRFSSKSTELSDHAAIWGGRWTKSSEEARPNG